MSVRANGDKTTTLVIIRYHLIQMSSPLETTELLAFSKIVDAKSLSRAAVELRIPRATISRRLARLEDRLGTRLLLRTTRSLTLTDAGSMLYRHARIVLNALGDAEMSVRRTDDALRGELRVAVPPLMDQRFFSFICAFAQQHPQVRVHVNFSSRTVDLRRDGYDVALRASATIEPGLVARTLARDRLVAVASPAYLSERGIPRSGRDLREHRCLMGFAQGEFPETHWPLVGGGKLQVGGAFFSNEVTLLREMALAGQGIALLPLLVVRESLEGGALVQVLPGKLEVETRIALVYPERKFVLPQVRAFVDAVTALARAEIGKPSPSRGPARRKKR